jgi:lysozyme
MLKGIDVSHWQNVINWDKVDADFAILKATEDVYYKDPTLETNREGARKNNILVGYYHFARGGDVVKEADYFLKSLAGNILPGELLALDWEIEHPEAVQWCRKFLDLVFDKTKVRPLLYTNEYRVKSLDWSAVVKGNYGLWVAKYGLNTGYVPLFSPDTGAWPFLAIWQYTSRGRVPGILGNVDLNRTKMDLDTLKKYGMPPAAAEEKVCAHCCPVHCPK